MYMCIWWGYIYIYTYTYIYIIIYIYMYISLPKQIEQLFTFLFFLAENDIFFFFEVSILMEVTAMIFSGHCLIFGAFKPSIFWGYKGLDRRHK